MTSYLSSLLGRAVAASPKSEGVEATAMPAQFYHSQAIFALEQRMFSRKWHLACHERLLDENGKYQLQSMAGRDYFVIRGKDGVVRAFFTACRHRGFPVLKPQTDDSGTTTHRGKAQIISCGYHGWSYSINGPLAKAPSFQDVPGFVKEDHGLLPLRVHVDKNGFVYVNMDHSADGISWKEQYGDFEDQPRFKAFDWENYSFSESWGMRAMPYNWKVLGDNYSECYHCSVTHPGFVQTTDLKTYNVKGGQGHIAHFVKAKPEALVPGTDPDKFAFNMIFPSASHTLTPLYFYTMRIVPTSARTCDVLYDVYRHRDCDDETYTANHKFFVQVETEDKDLCIATQKSLEQGVYQSGPLHPTAEAGVIYFQQKHIEELKKHFDLEQKAGQHVTASKAIYKSTGADDFVEEIEGCSGACGGKEAEW